MDQTRVKMTTVMTASLESESLASLAKARARVVASPESLARVTTIVAAYVMAKMTAIASATKWEEWRKHKG